MSLLGALLLTCQVLLCPLLLLLLQVNSAVNATVLDISRSLERRLADRLASKQDIQALSIRVRACICCCPVSHCTHIAAWVVHAWSPELQAS